MAVYKCKMCGGTLDVSEGGVATCEYCGSVQTLPKKNDEVIANLFNRANNLRMKCEFDKAAQIYEKILNEDNSDAEAHWGLVLCKYGIEYVEDPKTYKRIPTCHRTQYESVLADLDYLSALANSDGETKNIYKAQAEEISNLQKDILAIVKNEKPFDVFICYKETDESGRRTVDSALANDIYYQLTQEGMKVFYAAITLEDKLGVEYEPYIFAALNSAKVMLVVGTKPEHFEAIWVRNEWARFLKIMKTDRSKLLIPCYRDMDAYDLPEEFSHLQAQDMSKIGFVNDIVRGIRKIVKGGEQSEGAAVKETVVLNQAAGNADALLKRAFMALEDGEFAKADEFCEQALNHDAENPKAYLGKLMVELGAKDFEDMQNSETPIEDSPNYKKILRFGDENLVSQLEEIANQINENVANAAERARIAAEEAKKNTGKERIYTDALERASQAIFISELFTAIEAFSSIAGYKDSEKKIEELKAKAYSSASELGNEPSTGEKRAAAEFFTKLGDYKDSKQRAEECLKKVEKAEKARKAMLRYSLIIGIPLILIIIIVYAFINSVIIPAVNYDKAEKLLAEGDYAQAAVSFGELGDYKDAKEKYAEAFVTVTQDSDGKYFNETVSTGYYHTVGLRADGTVVAVGDNDYGRCDVEDWTDIVAVSAGDYHTVGLKADGTVIAVGDNDGGQCDVEDWRAVVAISAGGSHTVGLKFDGTVVAVGYNDYGRCDVEDWTDIVAVSAGGSYTVGLRADGTVVAVGFNGSGQCDVEGWTDIAAVSAGYDHTVGLKADGTVVAVGYNYYGQCDVEDWTDIVAVSAGDYHTVGLRPNGTVVAVGDNDYGQCDVEDWTDIVAVSAGDYHTVGLRADGTVVAVGRDYDGQCDVEDWKNIKLP